MQQSSKVYQKNHTRGLSLCLYVPIVPKCAKGSVPIVPFQLLFFVGKVVELSAQVVTMLSLLCQNSLDDNSYL